MPDTFNIRRAERRDEEALLTLWTSFLEEQARHDERFRIADDAAERWRNDFPSWVKAERRRVFVAEREGRVIGFATAQRAAPPPIYELTSELFVEELYVSPEARSEGAAARLLDALKAWGAEIGANRLRLGTLASNEDARAFWEHQGARAFSITYTMELETPTRDEGGVKPKGRLGFL